MPADSRVIDVLVTRLKAAGAFHKGDQAAPAAILWPDPERQWAGALPLLRERLTVLTLGPYDPAARQGPAIWLRAALAGMLPDVPLGASEPPVVYLPGYGREDLRPVRATDDLRPLVELQYRGVFWSHPSSRHWTVQAFLQHETHGAGITVTDGAELRKELVRALPRVLLEPVEALRAQAPLTAGTLRSLMHPDLDGEVLDWLNAPRETDEGFEESVRTVFGLHPRHDGPLHAAALLVGREGPWTRLWSRFREHPSHYPGVVKRLEEAYVPNTGRDEAWPQVNRQREDALRASLVEVGSLAPPAARLRLAALEQEHAERRGWVWSALGQAPLARALEYLAHLADGVASAPKGTTVTELAEDYVRSGWRVDAAVVQALACVRKPEDVHAVGMALRALYLDWLERANAAFQQEVWARGLPRPASGGWTAQPGLAVVFVDGLRIDVARLLEQQLGGPYDVHLGWQFAALPTVTPTAKPAVAPGAAALDAHADLHASRGGKKVTAEVLRAHLHGLGFIPLARHEAGDPAGAAWTEIGNLDRLGHDEGAFMSARLVDELQTIRDRVEGLLDAGYREVRVVTDHGWLLLPGGLPKVELPAALTTLKKGRAALLKTGSASDQPSVAWTWDPDVSVAVPRGVAAFEAGAVYEHGGVSLQECVVPVLTLTSRSPSVTARVASVKWTRLRCRVEVEGTGDWVVDLRRKAGDPSSSVAGGGKAGAGDGKVNLLVEDDEIQGEAAFVVLMQQGQVVAQQVTVIGGDGA
ncbi:hypothetical protein HNR42_002796 [Deinobacterium chartae]|uniref:BREX-1 system phosphatase PglZ type B n=1 Tax=Deinobacterium chartae TaxID=521158 RepID=A0A841I676_9DEIO|nr:BREX-1 system phosphatase PglZ type B [Deinobacterium chartae]MBB6099355.1 hypothetical protein [Deinobacterium chartae]